jgi:hypothetical protein
MVAILSSARISQKPREEYPLLSPVGIDMCRLTKVLPKSGTQFDNAMEILRNAEVPDLALKYKDLSAKLIEFELHRLTQSPTSMQVQDQVP